MRYENTVGFDTIVVIESLRPPDLRTGRDVFETTIGPAALRESLVAELHTPENAAQFIRVLRQLRALANDGHSPIIHIEAHGTADGIALISGERLAWAVLADELAAINQASRMNLLVLAAACEGFHLTSVLSPVSRAPAWGIIGPPDVVRAGDLYGAFTEFYSNLLSTYNLMSAMTAMNGGGSIDDWLYRVLTADLHYCHIYSEFIKNDPDGETPEQRVNRLVSEVVRTRGLTVDQSAVVRSEIADSLANHQHWFDYYKDRFLMLDLFPENRSRFTMTLEDCMSLDSRG